MTIELWQYNLLAALIGMATSVAFKRKAVAGITSSLFVVLAWFASEAINLAGEVPATTQLANPYAEALFWSLFQPIGGCLFALLGIVITELLSAAFRSFES